MICLVIFTTHCALPLHLNDTPLHRRKNLPCHETAEGDRGMTWYIFARRYATRVRLKKKKMPSSLIGIHVDKDDAVVVRAVDMHSIEEGY